MPQHFCFTCCLIQGFSDTAGFPKALCLNHAIGHLVYTWDPLEQRDGSCESGIFMDCPCGPHCQVQGNQSSCSKYKQPLDLETPNSDYPQLANLLLLMAECTPAAIPPTPPLPPRARTHREAILRLLTFSYLLCISSHPYPILFLPTWLPRTDPF